MSSRLLLRTEQSFSKIEHPFARYNAAGTELRCTLCACVVRGAGAAWAGHLSLKKHRLAAQAYAKEEQARMQNAKRRKVESETVDENLAQEPKEISPSSEDKNAVDSTGLPAGFFQHSDAGVTAESDSTGATAAPNLEPSKEVEEVDEDYNALLAYIQDEDLVYERDLSALTATVDSGATIQAEAVKIVPEGFPEDIFQQETEHTSQSKSDQPKIISDMEAKSEELKRREHLKFLEESDRAERLEALDEESRAQEEADLKVVAMKQKIQRLRNTRLLKK